MIVNANFEALLPATLAVPSKAAILAALMSGQSLPASELAFRSATSFQTTSFHLKQLLQDGFLDVRCLGRHRYYTLKSQTVAEVLEKLSILTPVLREKQSSKGQTEAMRRARMCYDHIAGRLGVSMMESFRAHGYLSSSRQTAGDLELTAKGEAYFSGLGINVQSVENSRRKMAYECIDWSERTPHLAGLLGALLSQSFQERGWIRKHSTDRALILTPSGRRALPRRVGLNLRILLAE